MGLLATRHTMNPSAQLLSFALAAGVPFATYLATASAYGYWLDGGEFVAASAELGISHPPGHPLAALVGAVAYLVPLGPMALRVALVSSVLAALAAGLLFRAVVTTIQCLGVRHVGVAVPIALGATWMTAASYGWWFQAVRPEVYALQAALICLALERLICLEARWPSRDVKPFYIAALALGLGLANHHFLALLLLPTFAPTAARVHRARGWRPLAIAASLVSSGLATYLYLPIRAAAGAYLRLGQPDDLARFFWVVSAEAFQKNTGAGVPDPLPLRLIDVLMQLAESMHVATLLLALGGAYVLIRAPGARRLGYIWLSVLVIFVLARAWLGFVRDNPDALGYLMPALGAVAALAACFVAMILRVIGGVQDRRPPIFVVAIALVVPLAGLAQVARSAEHASLARFTAPDAFQEVGRRVLPSGAVFIAHAPQTIFNYWGGEAAEHSRPDVTLVPVPFLTYPGMVDALIDESPELRGLLRGYLYRGELDVAELQSLAAQRPVVVELDPRVNDEVRASLVPSGLFYEALGGRAYEDDRRAGRERRQEAQRRLYDLLGSEREERETANQLLWMHYMDSLYDASVGDRDAARASIAAARIIRPDDAELLGLLEALGEPGEDGPIDVTPFMP